MTKQEVLNRLEELQKLEDMKQIIAEMDAVEAEYQKITEQEHQQDEKPEVAEHAPEVGVIEPTEDQAEAADEATATETSDVAETPAAEATQREALHAVDDKELDKKIKALLQNFNKSKEQYEARKEQDEHANLKEKQQVLEDLKNLIKEGPTITQAYDAFNTLKERWKTIGAVPRKNYKQLQSEYSHQIDMFFHTMQIFRDLKVYDLDKNYEAKKALIEKVKELEKETSINKVDDLLKVYQTEWAEMGPVKEEHWKEIRTDFWAAVNTAYDRIQAHYDSIRDRQKVALEAKEALGKIIVDILDEDLSSHKKWQEATEKVLQAQKDWNTTGNLAKKDNDKVYKEFRAACNVFFQKKKEFYGAQKEQSKAGSEAKMGLIAEAERLKDQTEWKNTTEALIRLQNEWKSTPSAGNKEDQRLWNRFRAACDYFFEAKKQYYATLDDRQAVNLKAKQEFIAKIEAFELSGNKNQDLDALKGFNEEWRTLGPVPKNDIDSINNAYKAALDAQYDKLKMSKTEKTLTQFKNKVDSLSSGEGGGRMIEQERREVQEQIKKLKETIDTYENNLGFFGNSKGSAALKEGVLKNIERTKEELAVWEAKLKQLPKPDPNAVREERPRFDSKPRFDRGGRGGGGGRR
ncbi:DUF349 domain-containing protein [soil metagenome]